MKQSRVEHRHSNAHHRPLIPLFHSRSKLLHPFFCSRPDFSTGCRAFAPWAFGTLDTYLPLPVMASATQQHDGDEGPPGTSSTSPASPRPAIAKLARPAPSPVLVHHRRPQSSTFSPTCTHMTMTRLYEPNFVCSMCHRPGQ